MAVDPEAQSIALALAFFFRRTNQVDPTGYRVVDSRKNVLYVERSGHHFMITVEAVFTSPESGDPLNFQDGEGNGTT